MSALSPVILLVSVLAVSHPDLGEAVGPALQDGRQAFDVDLPSDCTMTGGDPRMDFEVFLITCGAVDYAGVYVGNAANESMPRSRLLAAPYQWPSQVQVWSLQVSADQARADRIAASVRLRKVN